MKKTLIIFALLLTQTAFAGKIKDLSIEAIDSVSSVTGVSAEYLEVKSQQFIQVQDADVAIETVIRDTYLHVIYTCISKFTKNGTRYNLLETVCN